MRGPSCGPSSAKARAAARLAEGWSTARIAEEVGGLGGYTGGLERKRALLSLEGRPPRSNPRDVATPGSAAPPSHRR